MCQSLVLCGGDSRDVACRPVGEGGVACFVDVFDLCKPGSFSGVPFDVLLFATEGFDVGSVAVRMVVIDNDFVDLVVAFARGKNDSACILQHRDDERHNKCLREQILGRTEEARTLPIPIVLLGAVVASVTLPQGDVIPFQSFLGCVGAGDVLHPRLPFVSFVQDSGGIFFPFSEEVGHKVFDGATVGLHCHLILFLRRGQEGADLFVDAFHHLCGEVLLLKTASQHDAYAFLLAVDVARYDRGWLDVCIVSGVILSPCRQSALQAL